MSLAAYLAKNYLTADEPAPKKKKRKRTDNLEIIDDTPSSLPPTARRLGNPDDQEDLSQAQIVGDIVHERHRRTTNLWKPAVKLEDEPDAVKLEPQDEHGGEPRMESGAHAGLQTAAQVKAAIEEKERQDSQDWARHQTTGREHETIYRDATGRRVDVIFKRAELRAAADRAKREEEEKREEEQKQKELRAGLAQKRAKEAERERMKTATRFSRTRDDVEWNEELKAQERWDDPAAAFLRKKETGTEEVRGRGKRLKRVVPVYLGAAPPNRFGIRPGYRWDGVDRSNGFEKTWFRKQNERRAEKDEWDRWEAGADD